MRTYRLGLCLFVLLLLPWVALGFSGKLVSVIDGDTVEVLGQGKPERIRLADIDAPERGQAFGKKAKQFVIQRAAGKTVRVEPRTRDRYGRMVGEVFLPEGSSLNRELVMAGLAWHYKKYSSDSSIAGLEQEARLARRGLWQDRNAMPPWEFRHPPKGANPTETRLAERSPTETQTVYATISGTRYHREGCRHLKSCVPLSLGEARRKGLSPCRTCAAL